MKKLFKLPFAALFCLAVFTPTGLFAQSESGKKLYKRLGYKASISALQNQENIDIDEMAQIANSYRLNHDTQNAELWYSQVVEGSEDPNHYLHYAQALQSNGKRDRAKQYYLIYDEMMGGATQDRRGLLLAAAVDRMNEFEHSDVGVENVSALNSSKLDFSPAYYNDGVVFVSTRKVANDATTEEASKDIWIDDNFMCLFFAEQTTDGLLAAPQEFCKNITTKFHEGPVSFTRNGDQIFFTRNHYNKGKRKNNSQGVMKLQIYTANKSGEGWSEARELPFNTVEHEEAHPAISPDGTKLYFASDREGGFGGMDVYVSAFEGGTWSEPSNLGAAINTAGNEVFPFIHDDGTLYFASDGWGGIGGLDIFKSSKKSVEGSWLEAENIGTPFNSPKDDFGLVTNVLGTEGYFTSAREGGNGKDDIYKFVRDKATQTFKTTVCTYKESNDERIAGVKIEIQEVGQIHTDATAPNSIDLALEATGTDNEYLIKLKERTTWNTAAENFFTTNEVGETTIPLFPEKEYVAIAKKNGYEVGRENFSTKGKTVGTDNLDFCIPLRKLNCINLAGFVVNKKYTNKRIPHATITLINLCNGEELVLQTDRSGDFDFPCIECGCDYKVKGTKQYFSTDQKDVSTMTYDCNEDISSSIVLELEPDEAAMLAGQDPNNPNGTYPNGMYPNGGYPNGAYPNRPYPYGPYNPTGQLVDEEHITEGIILELRNIFYDFDKYYIREGAAEELDRVVALLETYPGMVIELSSHTDARGSNRYNNWLSKKRAQKAVAYITEKGIDSRRLIAAGYGETLLRNECGNFVECSEEEHQKNRRTEIKVIKFDRSSNVDVQYIDNAPEKTDPAPGKSLGGGER